MQDLQLKIEYLPVMKLKPYEKKHAQTWQTLSRVEVCMEKI